jgi:hypothetical protein
MSLDDNAPTGPSLNELEKQIDSPIGLRAMFQNGKKVLQKKAGKAGNRGDAAYFILKRAGESKLFHSFPSCP